MQKEESSVIQWVWVVAGTLFTFLGAHKILTGEPGFFKGVEIPAWTGWIQLPFGIWVLFLSIRTLWRNRKAPPEPPVNIDEAAARAEAAMDAMYLREHGKPPDKSKKDT